MSVSSMVNLENLDIKFGSNIIQLTVLCLLDRNQSWRNESYHGTASLKDDSIKISK